MGELEIMRSAKFTPALKTYWLVQMAWVMTVSCIGAPLLPFWLFGLGQWWAARQYNALQCHLTPRSLVIKQGVITRIEKNIPLEKITDLSLRQGVIQRWMGVHEIRVETAGQSTPGGADAVLVGIEDALEFRNAVLGQRDLVSGSSAAGDGEGMLEVLREIRDSLKSIETSLHRG